MNKATVLHTLRVRVTRDCCTSGQCFACSHLPCGTRVRVVQWEGQNDKELVKAILRNWSRYSPAAEIL